MAKTLQLKRYDTSTLSSTTGAEGELIVDTTLDTVTVHDGSTAGGTRLATESYVTSQGYITDISGKQDTLISGSNIKTINGSSILGSGDITIAGGGGGSTGDFTFSANTITLPFNETGVINTSGNVIANVTSTFSLSHGDWSGTPIFVQTISPYSASQPHLVIDNINLVSSSLKSALDKISVGSTLDITVFPNSYSNTVFVTAITSAYNYALTANSFQGGLNSTITNLSVTNSQNVASNGTFTMEVDGTFVTDSLFVGELFVANNIITPMNVISGVYNTESTQPLIVNSDLEVLGKISSTSGDLGNEYNNTFASGGASREDALSSAKQFKANKKYRLTGSGAFVLPAVSTLSPGDVVEVLYLYDTGSPTIYCYEDTTTMLGWTNLSSVSVNNDTYDYATLSSIGVNVKFVYYTTKNPIGGATQHKWMATQ